MKNSFLIKPLLILLISGSIASCNQKQTESLVVNSSKYLESLKKINQELGMFYSTNFIPGMVVAVSIDNQIIYADGFGYSNIEFKVPASPEHKYRIGQVSELIAALTAVKLSEEGILQIDKPVSEYLTALNHKHVDFTIRQLGAHTAGISSEKVMAGSVSNSNLETLIPSFIDDDLIYEPGTNFMHTELGFDLIAYLIEKSSNKPFNEAVQKTVLDSLKLIQTIADHPYRITKNKSSNYAYDNFAQPMVASQIDLRGKEASAGYLSSVLDLVKIGNTILYPGFLKPETIHLMTTPYHLPGNQFSKYSFGLIVSKDAKKRTFYGLRGSITGGCATLLIYPEDKMVIAIAANIQNTTWELPAFDLADVLLKQLHPEIKAEGTK